MFVHIVVHGKPSVWLMGVLRVRWVFNECAIEAYDAYEAYEANQPINQLKQSNKQFV
jgi:hypothetical protein